MESASVPVSGAAPRRARPVPAPKVKDRLLDELGELVVFSFQALKAVPGSLRYFSEVMRLNAIVTRRTSLLLLVMCMFLGASIANFAFFFLRSIGAGDLAGIVPGLVTTRQLAPQMFGYVFAGSIGCAIAAELGSARIQEEVDAYEAQGIDPMELLVGTRILAVLLYVPLATAIAMFGIFAGNFTVIVLVLHGNTPQQFLDVFFSIFVSVSMIYCAVTIAMVTLQCVLVACFYGMRGRGAGPVAVGHAVSRSVGVNLFLVHFVFSLAALVFYGGGLAVPIGD